MSPFGWADQLHDDVDVRGVGKPDRQPIGPAGRKMTRLSEFKAAPHPRVTAFVKRTSILPGASK
jgi:hypothetical protein